MHGRRGSLLLSLASLAGLLVVAAPADAKLTAKASLATSAGATRIVVKLSGTGSLPARSRPSAVSVRAGGRTYKLKRRGATWRSSAYRGAAGVKLRALAGKRVAVKLRSRAGTTSLRARLPATSTPTPAPPAPTPTSPTPTSPTPTSPTPTPPSPSPTPQPSGDITGQQAIDQMTSELSDGMVRRYQTSGDLSTTYELHLCADKRFRWYRHESYTGVGPVATEKFGQPWTVVEALIRPSTGYKGARVQGTFTYQNSLNSGQQEINEPAEARIEFQNGQWYWDGNAVETGTASCDPSF